MENDEVFRSNSLVRVGALGDGGVFGTGWSQRHCLARSSGVPRVLGMRPSGKKCGDFDQRLASNDGADATWGPVGGNDHSG
jgi:hypothetical protein